MITNQLFRTLNRFGFEWVLKPSSLGHTAIIQLLVGWVFVSEGIQKFLFPAIRGAGRFEKIGLPFPEILGAFVGSVEVICGLLVLLGLFTRLAVIPLLVIMITAILTTKISLGMEKGFWQMAHAARTDVSMFLGCLFLAVSGANPISVDGHLFRRWKRMEGSPRQEEASPSKADNE